jgi:hypothetical protein
MPGLVIAKESKLKSCDEGGVWIEGIISAIFGNFGIDGNYQKS